MACGNQAGILAMTGEKGRMWKWILTLAAVTGGGLLARSAYERKTLAVDTYEIKTDKIVRDRTFVFLSDLHDNCFGEGQKDLLDAIAREKPDAVLIGGDMMVVKKRADIDAALFFVEKLAKQYPVYYGNGNHENRMEQKRDIYGGQYDRLVKAFTDMGVHHLSDAFAAIDEEIVVYGLNLEHRYYKKFSHETMEADYIERRIGRGDKKRYQILLAHSPLYHDAYARWGADLTLCGHFHGGTIRIPGLGGLMTPQFQFFKKCCGGLFWNHGKAMIVSRGLGTHSINIRLNNKPELVVIRLRA